MGARRRIAASGAARGGSRRARSRSASPGRGRAAAKLRETATVPLGTPGGWIEPELRLALMAVRPWSLPASLVPVALAGTLLHVLDNADLLAAEFPAGGAVRQNQSRTHC